MTRDEVLKRMILIERTEPFVKAKPMNVRSRGENYVEAPEIHSSEYFDDFFGYEEELRGLIPARDTVSHDIDRFTDSSHYSDGELEQIDSHPADQRTGFIIMESIDTLNENDNPITNTINNEAGDLPFEFFQCNFIKENGERCKKQAKRDAEFCKTHQKYIEKNEL